MPRYLILKFENDDEFGLFPDDLEIMLFRHSSPQFKVKVVGEGILKPFTNLFGSPEFEVVPIGQTNSTEISE